MSTKIKVFPNKNEDKDIDPVKLTEFLEKVLKRVTLVKVSGNEDNLLFNDTIMLAMVAQQFWNRIDSLCDSIFDLTKPGQSPEQAQDSLKALRTIAMNTMHENS